MIPTIMERYEVDVNLSVTTNTGAIVKQMRLVLWDTAGQEEYDQLRPLAYPEADAILICFSVDTPDSAENVKDKVCPQLLK